MVMLGMVLRSIDILMIVAYFPLLVYRFRIEAQTQRLYLVGMLFLLFGVLNGSITRFSQPFQGPSLLYLIGIVLIWWQTVRNIRRDRERTP